MKAICITLPSNILWSEYKKELDQVKDWKAELNFKVPFLPKEKVDRCYLCYKGNIIGWMKIIDYSIDNFTCEVTGKKWSGYFIKRSGPFHLIKPVPMKGFQGFRYIEEY